MKTVLRIILLVVLVFLLVACDGEPTPTPTISPIQTPPVSSAETPAAQNRLKQTEPISMEDDMNFLLVLMHYQDK